MSVAPGLHTPGHAAAARPRRLRQRGGVGASGNHIAGPLRHPSVDAGFDHRGVVQSRTVSVKSTAPVLSRWGRHLATGALGRRRTRRQEVRKPERMRRRADQSACNRCLPRGFPSQGMSRVPRAHVRPLGPNGGGGGSVHGRYRIQYLGSTRMQGRRTTPSVPRASLGSDGASPPERTRRLIDISWERRSTRRSSRLSDSCWPGSPGVASMPSNRKSTGWRRS